MPKVVSGGRPVESGVMQRLHLLYRRHYPNHDYVRVNMSGVCELAVQRVDGLMQQDELVQFLREYRLFLKDNMRYYRDYASGVGENINQFMRQGPTFQGWVRAYERLVGGKEGLGSLSDARLSNVVLALSEGRLL